MNLFLNLIFYCMWFFSFSAIAGTCKNGFKTETTKVENEATNEVTSRNYFLEASEFPRVVGPFKISRSHKEAQLKIQGLKDIYTAGVDEAHFLISLAKKLQDSNADPYSTHIVDLVQQIPERIAYFRNNHMFKGKKAQRRLKSLKALEQEALLRAETEEVTYEWWLFWNMRLVGWATPNYHSRYWKLFKGWWKSHENMKKLLEQQEGDIYLFEYISKFPNVVILPTHRNLGLIAFNDISMESVAIIGLTARDKIADGRVMSPIDFVIHDLQDFWGQLQSSQWFSLVPIKDFFYQLRKVSKKAPIERRMIVEGIWFTAMIEGGTPIQIGYPDTIRYSVLTNIKRFEDVNDLGSFLVHSKPVKNVDVSLAEERLTVFMERFEEIEFDFYTAFQIPNYLNFETSGMRSTVESVKNKKVLPVIMEMVDSFEEMIPAAIREMGSEVVKKYEQEVEKLKKITASRVQDENELED